MKFAVYIALRNVRSSFFNSTCLAQSRIVQPRAFSVSSRLASTLSGDASSTPDLPKQNLKPKAATQLRRSASASLPIRANPTPTRSQIQPVSILTTAERYILPQMRAKLPQGALKLHESWWIPRWETKHGQGEVFVFENGSLVCWGLGEEDARLFAKQHVDRKVVEVQHLKEPETEDVEFVTDPNECVI